MIITVDVDGVPLCDLGGLGFEVTQISEGKADLRLPGGWKTREEGSNIFVSDVDGNDRVVVKHYPYGISCNLILNPRYSTGVYADADTDSDTHVCTFTHRLSVFDKGFRIADLLSIPDTEYQREFICNRDGLKKRENEAVAAYFADKPDWRNPLAYWSEP